VPEVVPFVTPVGLEAHGHDQSGDPVAPGHRTWPTGSFRLPASAIRGVTDRPVWGTPYGDWQRRSGAGSSGRLRPS